MTNNSKSFVLHALWNHKTRIKYSKYKKKTLSIQTKYYLYIYTQKKHYILLDFLTTQWGVEKEKYYHEVRVQCASSDKKKRMC